MKNFLHTLLFFSVLFINKIEAQSSNSIWYFGHSAGINFTSGIPVALSNNPMQSNEGCASMADVNGNVLFYTDGTYIWNRNNNYFPGTSFGAIPLGGDPSSTQSALIIPKPSANNLFYVFTTDAQVGLFTGGSTGTQYSIVDMNLNGGLGDIIQGAFPILLLYATDEKLAGTKHANGTDYWVLIHQSNTDAFYAYDISSSGVSAPVITHIGIVHSNSSGQHAESIGYLKFSPNGKKIALACYQNLNIVQIFDFDNATGIVSNPISDTSFVMTGSDGPYGISFSPDNSRLYVGTFGPTPARVYQYNMLAGTPSAIIASRTVVATENNYGIGALQIAPDGKIYVAKSDNNTSSFGSDTIDVIESPNALGVACNYQFNSFYLGGAGVNQSFWGLPNSIDSLNVLPMGIQSNSQNSTFQIYPNPVSKILYISADKNFQSAEIKISDVTGKILFDDFSNQKTIDVSFLRTGIYFLTMKSKEGIAVKKFVKE